MNGLNKVCGRCKAAVVALYPVQEVRHYTERNSFGRATGTRGRTIETINVCKECYNLKMGKT